ncbi:ATP-binding protein [Martelella sp. HB161492]|uniref:sensor histidine kinase n=1 Tax=Martelella sp. HB161492 TaxID=2720726 RepID=UPI0015927E8B|nr:ATP-binding protein [Martelella sp. HB161492]
MTITHAAATPIRESWSAFRGSVFCALLPVILTTLLLAALPHIITLPLPPGATVLDHATIEKAGALPIAVSLPRSWQLYGTPPQASVTYHLEFPASAVPERDPVLFIPSFRQGVDARLNGTLLEPQASSFFSTERNGSYYLAAIPQQLLHAGSNSLEISQKRVDGWISAYLSPVYLTTAGALQPYQKFYDFIIEQWRAASLALQAMIMISVIAMTLLRPRDRVFYWFSLMMLVSFLSTVAGYLLPARETEAMRLYLGLAQMTVSLLTIGLALALAERPRPAKLTIAIIALPVLLLILGSQKLLPIPVVILLAALMSIGIMALSSTIVLEHYVRTRDWISGIIAIPFGLSILFGLNDMSMMFGLGQGTRMLSPYIPAVAPLAIMSILTGRLVLSLKQVDGANASLQRQMADQENELRRLHEKDRERSAQAILEQERTRLMSDLHDGLSGHLVSIIAQSEKSDADPGAIGVSAREALDDLRLVVQSLDLGDDDLRVALASFQERCGPQLRRIGVQLDWSTEAMPPVTGITPSSALAILRILQEAVTNAVKHGPATRITIRAQADDKGAAIIVVENDIRRAVPPSGGYGLSNMTKRARSFGAEISFERGAKVARLTLHLPPTLRP